VRSSANIWQWQLAASHHHLTLTLECYGNKLD